MAQAIGSKAVISIQKETTYKEDPASPNMVKVNFISENLKLSRNMISSNTIQSGRNASKPVLGNINAAGSINTELQAYIGRLLEAAFGSVATTGTAPYTHTFTIGGVLPSYVIEKGFTDLGKYFKYNGCKCNKMSFSISPEGLIQVAFDFMGARETVGTSAFDSTITDLGKQSFNAFQAEILEGGSAIAVVTEISGLSIENNLDGNSYVIGGNGERASLPEGKVKVSGTLVALFDSLTLYDKAKNSTESSLQITWTFGDGLGSADNESLDILIPELIYSPNSPEVSGPMGVKVSLPFEAYYENSTEATTIQAILKNSQATI